MASNERSNSHASGLPPSAHEAREAMQDVDTVRARFGDRLVTPWWYKAVSSLLMGLLYIGAGMPYEGLSFGSASLGALLVIFTVFVGPFLLRELLKAGTGASLDRYRNGWTVPSLSLVALLVICVALKVFTDVEWAPLAGAGIAVVVTYLYERHIDQRLARGPSSVSRAPGRK